MSTKEELNREYDLEVERNQLESLIEQLNDVLQEMDRCMHGEVTSYGPTEIEIRKMKIRAKVKLVKMEYKRIFEK